MVTDLRSLVRDIPDFPKPGILFRDITPLLGDADAYRGVIDTLVSRFQGYRLRRVIGIEARGYMFACPLAMALGIGFIPARKLGKLPMETYRADYDLEYSQATLEIHRDALETGDDVLLVDDVLATGGTMAAAIDLVEQSGAKVAGIAVIIELGGLRGRSKLENYQVFSLMTL